MNKLGLHKANPLRGRNYRDHACKLYDEARPPCELTEGRLDEIFGSFDPLYDALSNGPHSRAAWAERMRRAGKHDAMIRSGRSSFELRRKRWGIWAMEPVEQIIEMGAHAGRLSQFVSTIGRDLRYAVEAIDFTHMSPRDKRELEQHVRYCVHMLEGCKLQIQIALTAHRDFEEAVRETDPVLPAHEE